MKKKTILGIFLMFVLSFALGCKIKKSTLLVPNTGTLCLDVVPASADLYVDGEYMGKVNQFTKAQGCLKLDVGTHTISIRKPGFASYERKIYIGAGEQVLEVRLGKIKGRGPAKAKKKK